MNRLNLVTLGTKDIVKAHNFFKQIGFKTSIIGSEENPNIIFFKNEGSKISLYPIAELAKDINQENPPHISNGFSGITLAYNAKSAEEVDEIFNKVALAGALIQKAPKTTSWGGYGGYFTDLDGYYWEVAYGPNWEFDEGNMLIIND